MKTMKTILVLGVILYSSLMNVTFAKTRDEIKAKINKKIVFERGTLPLNVNETEFVRVRLKVDSMGMLQVIQTNYSDETIKDMLVNKLEDIEIGECHSSEETFNYSFSFTKR